MIGKTRQSEAEIEEIFDPGPGRARGMLRRPVKAGKFRHSRRSPAPDLEFWIAHYWMISWDLRGCEPQYGESLPHPNVHLVFGEGPATIHGVQTNKFERTLEGKSEVFGVISPRWIPAFCGYPDLKTRRPQHSCHCFFW